MAERRTEEIAAKLATMHRHELIEMLRTTRPGFELDFTEDYLTHLPEERLRHIVLAACLHCRRPGTAAD